MNKNEAALSVLANLSVELEDYPGQVGVVRRCIGTTKGGITFGDVEIPHLEWYVTTIREAWQRSIRRFLQTGRLLLDAKEGPDKLPHGQFGEMIRDLLPFGQRTAEKLMAIARDRRISDSTHESLMPRHVETLWLLTKLPAATFKKALVSGKINAEMTRKDAGSLLYKVQATKRLATAAKQNVGNDISLWIADPPWQTSFALPYDTMPLQAIKEMRLGPNGRASTNPKHPTVAEASAPCAAIGLWAIDELLYEAEEVLAAWGFKMLTPRIIWQKHQGNIGEAAFHRHEYFLIGVRGGAVPTSKPNSVVTPPPGKLNHSQKPLHFHSMLKTMFPLLIERIELFARRTPPDGWRGWGNQNPGPRKLRAA